MEKQIKYFTPIQDETCLGAVISRGFSSYHTGVDISKYRGCWINSIADGIVREARWFENGLGYAVIIDHFDGSSSLYAHGSGEFLVSKGMEVSGGQNIMYMGSSGMSPGTHLHFSIAIDYKDVMTYSNRVNPMDYIDF